MADQRSAEETSIIRGAEAIDLQEGDSHGVLLLHGFGDTPQTLSLLAQKLARSGYSVRAPLLPGHGRSMAAFVRARADDWADAAQQSLREMQQRYEQVSVVGLSMGSALAVAAVSESPQVSSLTLIAPYVGMPLHVRVAASTHWAWGRFAGEINARNPRSIRDPIERERNLAYGTVTGRTLFELWKVVKRARKALHHVKAPTLIVLSREDPRVSPETGEFALRQLGSEEKKIMWTEGAGHIITVDYGRERVFTEILNWIRDHDGRGATAARKRERLSSDRKR
jgi:carboxylesterase